MLSIDSMLSPNPSNYDGVSTRPSASTCASKTTAPSRLNCPPQPLVGPSNRSHSTRPRYVSWLIALAYPLARHVVLPFYFRRIEVTGREHIPATGPIILAPTHRSRWDALIVPYAAGQDVTGRLLRFMVTSDEMKGIQGWLIRQMGGFPINTRQPAIAALRHSIDLLQRGETLVIFPEGDIFRQCQPLKPGLARLALQAEASQPELDVQIVPIGIQYSKPFVPWRSSVKVQIGQPMKVANYSTETPKLSARKLTSQLERALRSLSGAVYSKAS
jgi:1-acyl-sn-glycerol-3-phosphate acyltransferase